VADTKPTILSILKDALGDRLDPAATGFLDLLAEDLVFEFPYARPGMQTRIEGRGPVIAYLASVAGSVTIEHIDNVVAHQTADPEVVIVEFDGHGQAPKVGEPYHQRYISVIRTGGGKIVHYKDYWNPIQGLKAQLGSAAVDAFILGGATQLGGAA
jgi:uncharacterized protein